MSTQELTSNYLPDEETGNAAPASLVTQEQKDRDLSVPVILAFCLMVLSNVLSTATKVFNNTDNKEISDANPTYLSPDGTTFSIWGFIYLFEATLIIYQVIPKFKSAPGLNEESRKFIISAFLFNAIWLPVFQFYYWWLSLAIIVIYLASLWKAYDALGIHYAGKAAPWHTKVFAHVGISLNLAWVCVATLLNITVVSRNSGIITTTIRNVANTTSGALPDGSSSFNSVIGGNPDWAVLCICIACALAVYRSFRTVDIPYAFVTCWALGGIYRMQTTDNDSAFPVAGHSDLISRWAIGGIIVVAIAIVVGSTKAFFFPRD
jgi:hypothetical protein